MGTVVLNIKDTTPLVGGVVALGGTFCQFLRRSVKVRPFSFDASMMILRHPRISAISWLSSTMTGMALAILAKRPGQGTVFRTSVMILTG